MGAILWAAAVAAPALLQAAPAVVPVPPTPQTAVLPAYSAPIAAPMTVAVAPQNILHAGTAIQLETRDNLTTEHKLLKVGQRFDLDVLQPVMLDGQVAIPAGSRAVGEVVTVRNKGMWGKSGGITCRVLSVEANGQQLRLNGTFDDRGETGTAGVVAAVAFVPVAGFFVTGTSAKIAPGSHVTAFLAEEVPVQFGSPEPHKAMIVPTVTPAALVTPPPTGAVPPAGSGSMASASPVTAPAIPN